MRRHIDRSAHDVGFADYNSIGLRHDHDMVPVFPMAIGVAMWMVPFAFPMILGPACCATAKDDCERQTRAADDLLLNRYRLLMGSDDISASARQWPRRRRRQ
jgi:hypothetical protein